jgi:hypothetical protein
MKQVEITPGLEWDKVLEQAEAEDVILMRQGHAVALLSAFDDADLAWYAREREPGFLASLGRAREQIRQGKSVSHEALKRELGVECTTVLSAVA